MCLQAGMQAASSLPVFVLAKLYSKKRSHELLFEHSVHFVLLGRHQVLKTISLSKRALV